MIMSDSNDLLQTLNGLNIDAVNIRIQHEGGILGWVQRQNGETQKIVGPLWHILVTVSWSYRMKMMKSTN